MSSQTWSSSTPAPLDPFIEFTVITVTGEVIDLAIPRSTVTRIDDEPDKETVRIRLSNGDYLRTKELFDSVLKRINV